MPDGNIRGNRPRSPCSGTGKPPVLPTHLPQSHISVKAFDTARHTPVDPCPLLASRHYLADRKFDYVCGASIFQLGYQLVYRLFGHNGFNRVTPATEKF